MIKKIISIFLFGILLSDEYPFYSNPEKQFIFENRKITYIEKPHSYNEIDRNSERW